MFSSVPSTEIATGFPVAETNKVLKLNGPAAVGTVAKPAQAAPAEPKAQAEQAKPAAAPAAKAERVDNGKSQQAAKKPAAPDSDEAVDEGVELPPFLQRHSKSA